MNVVFSGSLHLYLIHIYPCSLVVFLHKVIKVTMFSFQKIPQWLSEVMVMGCEQAKRQIKGNG